MANGMTQTQIQDVPGWMRGPLKGMVGTAEELVQEPYQQYEGPRIADFNQMQQQAFQGISGLPQFGQDTLGDAGDYMRQAAQTGLGGQDYLDRATDYMDQAAQVGQQGQSYLTNAGDYMQQAAQMGRQGEDFLTEAGDYARQGGQSWVDADHQAYMNPYVEQALDPTAREIGEAHDRTQNQIGQRAAQTGAFGGSRQGVMEGMANENYQQEISDLYNQGYSQAYGQGRSAFDADRTAAAQTGQGLQNISTGMQGIGSTLAGAGQGMQGVSTGMQDIASTLGGSGQGMQNVSTGMQDISSSLGRTGQGLQSLAQTGQGMYGQGLQQVLQAGGQQQALDQANLDTAYGDFQEQRDYPYGQLSFLGSLIRGVPQVGTTYSEVERPSPSEDAQWLGAGISGLGLMNQLGG